jgi:undecaprenyl-diphosphatase
MNRFDVTAYHLINHLASYHTVANPIMAFFAQYSPELYGVMFIVAWFTLPKQDSQQRHVLVVSAFAGILGLLLNFVIANVWYRPRPFVTLPNGTFTQLVAHVSDASFPSDHVSGGFGFAAATWGRGPRWIRYGFTVLAVVVMIARVYVGVHWPTDVIAGLIVGMFSGKVIWRVGRYLYPVTNFGLRIFGYGSVPRV